MSVLDLGYTFQDQGRLTQALTHKSKEASHNERLEFLGDAVLSLSIATALYHRYPQHEEGALSQLRASLVNQTTLVMVATTLHLQDHLLTGPSCPAPYSDSILADAVEAVIGAIYLDANFNTVDACIRAWWGPLLDQGLTKMLIQNYKSLLQEWCQARQVALPTYAIITTQGQNHAPIYTVSCTIEGQSPTNGCAPQKQTAEQHAAKAMLQQLKGE
jgi:ribonuclease-3